MFNGESQSHFLFVVWLEEEVFLGFDCALVGFAEFDCALVSFAEFDCAF
jgi:hypothetical protein